MPRVTVVVPTYNRGQFVAEAIQSVLEQTFRDFELIVVDDGSTDDTTAVVGCFTDPRLHYVYQTNQERSAARNHGLRLAQGEYVAFLDSDDVWLPTKLEHQVTLLDARPAVGLVYTGAYIFEGQRTFTEQRPRWRGQALKALLMEDNVVCGSASTALVRRACFDRVGGFDENLRACEDWDMWLRIVAAGYEFDFVPQPLARCRVHGTNTQKDAEKMARATRTFFAKVLAQPAYFASGEISRTRVQSLMELMVGRAYYIARQMAIARRHFLRSLWFYPLQGRAVEYLLRSLLGTRMTEVMRGWRNRLGHFLRYRSAD
jgi:glycosyltransferase involved in cell wall biosynthesis